MTAARVVSREISRYQPQPGSVAWCALMFFARNSDEELFTTDIAAKWDTKRDAVRASLSVAVHVGWIARESQQGREAKYRAGPRISEWRNSA